MRAWLEQRQAGVVPNYTVVKAVAEQATEQAHSLLSDVCSATEAETIVKQLCQQCERPHDGLSLSLSLSLIYSVSLSLCLIYSICLSLIYSVSVSMCASLSLCRSHLQPVAERGHGVCDPWRVCQQ